MKEYNFNKNIKSVICQNIKKYRNAKKVRLMDLAEAIDVTTSNVSGLLSNEFRESIREVTFGKSLSEALNDMQERIPSDTINNVVLSLTQSNLYGNSIIENLYTQIDYLREKN